MFSCGAILTVWRCDVLYWCGLCIYRHIDIYIETYVEMISSAFAFAACLLMAGKRREGTGVEGMESNQINQKGKCTRKKRREER